MEEQQKVYFFAYAEEAEQISQLYNYLADKGAELEPISDDRFANILQVIKGSKILGKSAGEDLEEIFNSILSVVIGFAPEDAFKLIQEWGSIVLLDDFPGTGWQSHAGFAVVVFSNLFHFYEADPKMKLYLFNVLLKLSGRAKVTKALDLSSSTIETYFQDWNLSTDEQIEVLRILHLALLADNRGRDAADIMIRLLKTYPDANAAQVEPDACECVRTAIVDPQTFSFDHLLRIKAIQQLEKSKPSLFQLLKIFSHGSLNDYNNFVKDHPNFVKDDLKFDSAALLKKIKILTLISVSESNKNLSYETLKKELDIATDDDLEKFMIDVLQSKAVIGKLNGVKKEFNVTAFEKRAFDKKEWIKLRNNLGNLLENLKQIKKNIDVVTVPNKEMAFRA